MRYSDAREDICDLQVPYVVLKLVGGTNPAALSPHLSSSRNIFDLLLASMRLQPFFAKPKTDLKAW
jgi:hypothetical protein